MAHPISPSAWRPGKWPAVSAARRPFKLTCDSWRDSAGKLWQPNYLATVDLPTLKLSKVKWIIATVTFRKDASGTHADLTLMPPDAFSVQPSTLNIFDREFNAGSALEPGSSPADHVAAGVSAESGAAGGRVKD